MALVAFTSTPPTTSPPSSSDLDGPEAVVPPAVATTAVLVLAPEYIYGLPGSLENALDWLALVGSFHGNLAEANSAALSALGSGRARSSLLLTLRTLGGRP